MKGRGWRGTWGEVALVTECVSAALHDAFSLIFQLIDSACQLLLSASIDCEQELAPTGPGRQSSDS